MQKGKALDKRGKRIRNQYRDLLKELAGDSQKHDILKYLMDNRSITQAEAVEHLDCYRLSARISELRDAGVNIVTHMEDNVHKRGQHGRYFLEEKESMVCLH